MKKLLITSLVILCFFSLKAQESKIVGNWQLNQVEFNGDTETGLKAVFIFAENGLLKAARDKMSRKIDAGTWQYNKKTKTIVMTSDLDKDFNGDAKVIKVNNKKLIYKKDGATFSFLKFDPLAETKIKKPILSFEQEQILDEGFNYEEVKAKLPWRIEAIVNNLKDYTEIIYNITVFRDEQEPNESVRSEKINYNADERTIDVRSFSYFQNDYIDMMENPILINNLLEHEDYYMFFPMDKLEIYQVVGTEKLETPAGIFECTIVEGFGRFDKKVKYWMVNQKPGVFAKVITVNNHPVPFGKTEVYILKEIK